MGNVEEMGNSRLEDEKRETTGKNEGKYYGEHERKLKKKQGKERRLNTVQKMAMNKNQTKEKEKRIKRKNKQRKTEK